MPFGVVRQGSHYKIYKLKEKEFAKPEFKTKQAAMNQAKNWMRFRHEKPDVRYGTVSNLKKIEKERKKASRRISDKVTFPKGTT